MALSAKKIYNWAALKVHSPFSALWLGLVFLTELIFFVPLDAVLVLFCLENPGKRYLYAASATLASIICALAGYFLGLLLWDLVGPYMLNHLISANFFEHICNFYNSYENWTVFLGSFLPLPFKAITLSAGVCEVDLVPFIACVVLARALRFCLVAKASHQWGVEIKGFLDRHFGRVLMAIGAKIALAFTFFWVLSQ